MDSNELLSGEETPPRGSAKPSTSSSMRKEKESNEDDKEEAFPDDDSFVTMEEIKDTKEDSDFYKQLGYEPTEPQSKRPSKVKLIDSFEDDAEGQDNESQKIIRSSFRRLSHRLSRELVRRRSSLAESLPDTPAGWTVLVSGLASALLGYEVKLKQSLSCPPLVFAQCGDRFEKDLPLQQIYQKLTERPDSILSRPIEPSLFIGTRSTMSSVAAYALLGPGSTEKHLRFRQLLTMSGDGAKIALEWELPPVSSPEDAAMNDVQRRKKVLSKGGIDKPLILVMTGMNNHAKFGYIKALQRCYTNRGWVAVAMNFRGCGGVPLATPRCYNGGYTGDLRGVVHYLSSRLAPRVPLFIVGNSLSANLVTKYLGEEGDNLPSCVAGGAALGNPLLMHINNLSSPWKEILALGVKKDLLLNWPALRQMNVPSYREAIYNTMKARSLGDVDEALSPIFIRNENQHPYAVKVGFRNAEEYWADSSSFKYIKNISVPCLQIVAGDDMIVYKSFGKKLAHCIQNPYVMCVETKCGGHLGWQESPPDSNAFGFGTTSWADRATADFFDAILQTGTYNHRPTTTQSPPEQNSPSVVEAAKEDTPLFISKL